MNKFPKQNNQNTKWPKISIVTPSFNQGQFLEETIQSVLSQNYPNLEYIIIDGGSTDKSVEIIKKYEEYLTYWVSEPDGGHANALNKGFEKSTGDIMAWINSDDKYYPWTFKTIAEIFTSTQEIDWLTGVPSHYDKYARIRYAEKVLKNKYDFLTGNYKWIQQESTFWKRSLWEKSGSYIDENYKLMVDGELWTRFFLYADLWHSNLVLGGYRVHEANRANINMADCISEMNQAIAKMAVNTNSEDIQIVKELNIEKIYIYEKYLKFLPHNLFRKIMNSILRKKRERLEKVYGNSFGYKLIVFDNKIYQKKVASYFENWKKY